MIAHSTGVRVVCSPRSGEEYKEVSLSDMVSLFEIFQTMGDYVFAVVPTPPSDEDKALLAKCDFIVEVTESGHDGLATAGASVALLERPSVGRGRLGAVVFGRDGLLSELELSKKNPTLEATIDVPLLAIVAHDAKASLQFESQDIPVTLAERRRPMAAPLMQVADWFMYYHHESQRETDD